MIEADLRTFLLSQPAISALVGTRFYPLRLPQGVAFPAITYQTVFGTSEFTHDGPAHLGRRRIQIDCWAKGNTGYNQVVALADEIRTAVVGYLGAMGGTPYAAGRLVNVLDIPEPEPALWRRMVEIALWHEEA